MASGKLSPRQKMINMMYLVLTALLALNVSAEILQAFESLRTSLRKSADNYSGRNEKLLGEIVAGVDNELKAGEKKHETLKSVATDVSQKSSTMIAELTKLTQELEAIGGFDAQTGELRFKDETQKNYRFWLGDNDQANGGAGNGKAAELKQKLNAFIQWANSVFEKEDPNKRKNFFSKIALEPSEDPSITDQESKHHVWEYHTFHNKPVVADLAMVEKFKMDIREVESQLLQLLRSNLDDNVILADTMYAMEAPMSNIVAAGMEYQSRIFLTMGSRTAHPEFAGPGVSVDPTGLSAVLKMSANGAVIPDGKAEGIQRYSAKIKVPQRDGTFKELPLEGSFTVRRPEVVVRSKVVQLLYRGCANTVTVDVPALGEHYHPDFSKSTGGKAITSGTNVKDVTLVPSGKDFKLSVYSNTNGQSIKIDEIKYNVVSPPEPRLVVIHNGNEYKGNYQIPKGQSVILKLVPDKEFAALLPRDARYKSANITVSIQSGMFGTKAIATLTGNLMEGVTYQMSGSDIRQLTSGAKIYFEIAPVSRVNFQGAEIPEPDIDIYDRSRFVTIK